VKFVLTTLFLVGTAAFAQDIDDPLHGCIIGDANCYDNGTVTPTSQNPLPNFTFTISPGPNTGNLLVDFLVPDDAKNVASLSFFISASSGGSNDNSNISPVAASLQGHWTSGELWSFLGLSGLANGAPKNNIQAWLPYTQGNNCGAGNNQACDPGATGYQVYQVDLGTNLLQSPSDPTKPVLTVSGSDLPIASLLVGFLSQTGEHGTTYISTANSGAVFVENAPGPLNTQSSPVPEPSSIVLFASMLFGAGTILRKKIRTR
jgi:hypothetical protein